MPTETKYTHLSVETLLDFPNLPKLLKEAEKILAQETKDREQFYANLREDQKAEFIYGKALFHSPVMRRHWLVSREIV